MAQKAKNALVNAFLEIVEKEEFEKITVTALVEKCNISRQTFYYHFNDIEELLSYAFNRETEQICNSHVIGKWIESAKLYVNFLNKYDTLIRKSAKSSEFIMVYNMLYNSFFKYLATYLDKKLGRNPMQNSDSAFLMSFAASAFCGLVIKEIQQEESDYTELLNKIAKGFNLIPK